MNFFDSLPTGTIVSLTLCVSGSLYSLLYLRRGAQTRHRASARAVIVLAETGTPMYGTMTMYQDGRLGCGLAFALHPLLTGDLTLAG
jgi:hypothetical protein